MDAVSIERKKIEAALEYLGGNWTKLLSRFVATLVALVGLFVGAFVYLWQTGKANSDEIIRLKSETANTELVIEKIDNLRLEIKADIRETNDRTNARIDRLHDKVNARIDRLREKVDETNKILLERLPPLKKK